MIKKLLAVLAAVSVTVSALPLAVFADEATDEIIEAIVSADDISFEEAVEALGEIEEPDADEMEAEETTAENDAEPKYDIELFSDEVSLHSIELNEAYDVVTIDNNFDTEANTGAPDGTNYKISDGTDQIWSSTDISVNSNYYLSVDFKLASGTTGNQIKMTNSKGDVGPQFSVSGSDFRNQTGSNAFPVLYDNFDTDKWYKLELEGRMSVVGSVTSFTLYEYDESGKATQVAQSEDLYLRNFTNSGGKSYGYTVLAEGVCYDNEYAVQEYPNSVVITEENELTEITGGDSLQFTAIAQRNGSSDNLTQPTIVWSLSGVTEGEEDYITIDDGRLAVNALASEQTITVMATASSNGKPYAEYPVAVKQRSLDDEPFDSVTVSGSAAIDAGSSEIYTITATKNGEDVTESISDSDVKWSIYDSTGARVLGNRYITAENGVVTVDKNVIGQDIRVRASTADGYVYGEISVTVNNKSSETIIQYNACEDKIDDNLAIVNQGSWDGSSYYMKNTSGDFITSGKLGTTSTSGDVLLSMDLRFMSATGSGITTIRRDGGTGLWLCSHNGLLAVQTGGSAYNDLTADGKTYSLDTGSWYHIDLMFNTAGASLNIWKYDESGNMTDKASFTSDDGLVFRSAQGFNRFTLNSDTGLDNYRAVYPDPTELEITSDTATVGAGSSLAFGISGSRDGLTMPGLSMSAVNWYVYDSENLFPIDSDDITIAAGVFSTDGLTSPQTVYIRAVSTKDKSIYASLPVTITSANQFEITNVGIDSENERQLVKLYVNKLTDYTGDVVFIMTFFDENSALIGSYAKKANAKNLKSGENEIAVDYTLPESYNKETGTAKVMAWTSMTTQEEPEGISGGFAALYSNGTITLNNLPAMLGKVTIAVYNSGVKDNDLTGDTSAEIVYASQSESTVSSIYVPNLSAGTYTIAIGGTINDAYSVCRAEFIVE